MREKIRRILPVLMLSLMFPAFVIGFGVLFDVDTLDVTAQLVPVPAAENETAYTLMLPEVRNTERYNLMFATRGNAVEISCGGEVVYSYGADRAALGKMLGARFVDLFLPGDFYGRQLTIRLRAVDANADRALAQAELCPHAQSTRYYLTNQTLGFPLALVLFSMACCIPSFLVFGGGYRLLREGVIYGSILICLSLLLLSEGGHFLLFSPRQERWNVISYFALYLFPMLFLLFFFEIEERKRNRCVLGAGAAADLVFLCVVCVSAAAFGRRLCDFERAYQALLALNGAIGLYEVIDHLRGGRLSRVKRMLILFSVIWVVIAVVFELFPLHLERPAALPHFDFLCVIAVILFYLLCGFLIDYSHSVRAEWTEKNEEIRELKLVQAQALSTEAIAKAMSENYESIYAVDAETSEYYSYYESSDYGELGLVASGGDFFAESERKIPTVIYKEDQAYLQSLLTKEALTQGTKQAHRHSIIYRIAAEGSRPVYHQLKAVRRAIGERDWFLIGIQNIDDAMQRESAHLTMMEKMQQKNITHLEAVLRSAAGYIEADLTENSISDISVHAENKSFFSDEVLRHTGDGFTALVAWLAQTLVAENHEAFLKNNDPAFLIEQFHRGELRMVTTLTFRDARGDACPCREVFYLYQDKTNDHVLAFIVIYDLTEQQRAEKERAELEEELRMSRIRVFTGQMQPHFLYNALGSIQEIVLEDPDYASKLIGDFTIHLRSSIRAMSNDEPIPFEKELENIVAYTNIEKMRFGSKLKMVFDIQAKAFDVLPLSIQPLVENAIRHGVYQRGPAGGTVTLRSRETAEDVIVEIIDDGVGFDYRKLKQEMETGKCESTALKNLMFRLDKLMGAEVRIRSVIGQGTEVTVRIPKGGKQDESDYR